MRRSTAAFYSLIFEIAYCLAGNTVQYGVLTDNEMGGWEKTIFSDEF